LIIGPPYQSFDKMYMFIVKKNATEAAFSYPYI